MKPTIGKQRTQSGAYSGDNLKVSRPGVASSLPGDKGFGVPHRLGEMGYASPNGRGARSVSGKTESASRVDRGFSGALPKGGRLPR